MDGQLGPKRLILNAASAEELQSKRRSGGHIDITCICLSAGEASLTLDNRICTFSCTNGKERLIFSQLSLHIQMTDPDYAFNHCPSCRLSCTYEFIHTPVLKYNYFIYKAIIKMLL